MATRYVALLRGVNVGGHQLAMADLRAALEDAGATEVTTYIQSGNAVFTHRRTTAARLESDLATAIGEVAGYEVPVFLRTANEWAALIDGNPFDASVGKLLHVLFLRSKPEAKTVAALEEAGRGKETVATGPREVYLHLPDGFGRSKLAAKANEPRVGGTIRNWNTVLKLQELAASQR